MRHVYNLFLVAAATIVLISMITIFDKTVMTSGKFFAVLTIIFPIILIVVFSRLAYIEWKNRDDNHNTPSLT